jgi:hypothetical protein
MAKDGTQTIRRIAAAMKRARMDAICPPHGRIEIPGVFLKSFETLKGTGHEKHQNFQN